MEEETLFDGLERRYKLTRRKSGLTDVETLELMKIEALISIHSELSAINGNLTSIQNSSTQDSIEEQK